MIKTTTLLFLFCSMTANLSAQKNIRNFIFGHSLINHAIPINPIPSQETSVPHWFASLAKSAGNQYAVGGQYGFLPQHANLPPTAQWGFDNAAGAWDSDNEEFSKADFNTILITPGNFIQWQAPNEDYPSEPISPVEATNSVFDWCNSKEPELKFYIYENWPDMAPFLGDNFPPNVSEWQQYNNYLNSDFHDWFLDYYTQVAQNFQNNCVSFIPVGTVISKILQREPFNGIPISELYEDDAPHGRPTIYFLASLITYMTLYEEQAPLDYEVAPIIHSTIGDNYLDVIEIIWSELNKINEDRNLTVFCNEPITSSNSPTIQNLKINISPNPTSDIITIAGEIDDHIIDIYNMQGVYQTSTLINSNSIEVDLATLQSGAYLIVGKGKLDSILYRKMIVKL